MTSLNDLADVDTTGKEDQDRLAWDETLGLWVPQAAPVEGSELELSEGTLTYPAGDNGWVYVDDASADPYVQDHIQNTGSIPSADAAFLTEFTVTSAMLDIGGTEGLVEPFRRGLWVSLSGVVDAESNGTQIVAAEIDGTEVRQRSQFLFSSRLRASVGLSVPCEVGDVVRLHAWKQAGAGDTIDWTHVLAASYMAYLNALDAAEDNKWAVQVLGSTGFENVTASPDGLGMGNTGTVNNTGVFGWLRQSGSSGQTLDAGNNFYGGAFRVGDPSRLGFRSQRTSWTDSTLTGDPRLVGAHRITSYNFLTGFLPEPT